MRIPDLDPTLIARACCGDARALDDVVTSLQPGVYALAVRMLGDRDDAADAAQEILIRVVTHLSGFRGEAVFSTWVYRVARNRLMTAVTKARESPERTFSELGERLGEGLPYGLERGGADSPLTPLDKAEAADTAVRCTQGMLLSLDRDHRLAYVLDAVFGLPTAQGAAVLEIAPAAYRKRLSRARARLHGFMNATCGLANESAACRCDRQLAAVRAARGNHDVPVSMLEAAALYDELVDMHDAASVLRAHPEPVAPERMVDEIRDVLRRSGWPVP